MSFNWELAAEFVSLASGLSLAWPALRLNKYLRIAHDQSVKAEAARSRNVRSLRQSLAAAYASPRWNRTDSMLTLLGVGLCIVASGIKILTYWQK
jgi:hypothetical protein